MATRAPGPQPDLEYAEQKTEKSLNEHALRNTLANEIGVEHGKAVPQWNRPRPSVKPSKRKVKVQDDSILAAVCAWIVEHQIGRTP